MGVVGQSSVCEGAMTHRPPCKKRKVSVAALFHFDSRLHCWVMFCTDSPRTLRPCPFSAVALCECLTQLHMTIYYLLLSSAFCPGN